MMMYSNLSRGKKLNQRSLSIDLSLKHGLNPPICKTPVSCILSPTSSSSKNEPYSRNSYFSNRKTLFSGPKLGPKSQ